jgi:hypothetical protein
MVNCGARCHGIPWTTRYSDLYTVHEADQPIFIAPELSDGRAEAGRTK